jgi:hypothetical protein
MGTSLSLWKSIVAIRLNWSLRHLLDLVSLPSVWRFKETCEAFAVSHLICNTQMPVHAYNSHNRGFRKLHLMRECLY